MSSCSHGLFSEDNLPRAVIEWLQDLFHRIDLILRTNEHVVVLHVVHGLLVFAVISHLVNKHTEGSWHASCSVFCSICLQVSIRFSQEICYCSFSSITLYVFLELLIVITTSCCSACSSDCFSSQKVIEILNKIGS